jgi:hypothetical protein
MNAQLGKAIERILELALVLAIVAVGGYVVLFETGHTPSLGAAPTATPDLRTPEVEYATEAPGTQAFSPPPAAGGLNGTAALGEGVPIVDLTDNHALGTVTVVKAKRAGSSVGYLAAKSGYVYVAAYVRYAASAAFTYNMFDWGGPRPGRQPVRGDDRGRPGA